jgi:ATP-binding cassette subfamily C exporter for protease/lipase
MTLGMRSAIVARWRQIHEAALAKGQEGGEWTEMFSSFSRSFRLLLQSALLTVGAYLALQQEITPGMIIAASIIAGRALAPIDQVLGQWRAISRGMAAHKRLMAAFDAMPKAKQQLSLPDPKGELEVKNLIKLMPPQSHTKGRQRILNQISFNLSPGDGLGVIGNSAAGKSSLAKILVGAWQPDAGEVRLDGATLDQWPPEVLGRHVGYLPQAVEVLPGTIAQHIGRFDTVSRDADVIEAAKIAGVHDMIVAFPDGYATVIGHHAQPLSSGQIQQLGLARALYRIPRLVVLDEPNSNLDAVADDAMSSAIQVLRDRGSVVIVMAHRPSAISSVNKLLLLQEGRVVYFGDKEETIRLATTSPSGAPAVKEALL